MTSYFSTVPHAKQDELASAYAAPPPTTDADSYGFEVVAGDYVPHAQRERGFRPGPYSSTPLYSDGNTGAGLPPFHQTEEWAPVASIQAASGGTLPKKGRFHIYGFSPVSDAPNYDVPHLNNRSPPLPPLPINSGADGIVHSHGDGGMNPYTYRGQNVDYTSRKQNRLHQDFKALPKEERQRLVEREAATSDLLARTVHLRFLPLTMMQSELGAICSECGEYLRVRICGNSTNNQNWIYGFVEFATTAGAEAMMRRSGMELSNGPGRPPLRLKCNSAKQPIVDRVFHDADPATGSPCIFGLGNFAKRTLGDALESYYNLKEKEAQHLQETPATPFSAGVSPKVTASSARQPVRLSPHARAFEPSSSPLLGAEYLPGVHNAPTGTTAGSSNGDHWTSPLLAIAAATRNVDSDAGSTESATGITSTVTKHYTSGGQTALLSSATPPCRTYSPNPDSTFITATYSSGAVSNTTPSQPAITNPVTLRRREASGSNTAVTPLERVAAALCVPSDRVGSALPDFLLPPSNAMGFSTHSDLAGSELSLALQNMMLTGSATDGDEVLERGRELTLRAISQAHCFLNSEQGFYDAMGTLRSLVELLDCHSAVTGGALATGSGDHTAELPQRATQLRLLANLMMALLYMMKRNLSEALPHIHAVVMSCNEIPVVCLSKTQQQQQQLVQQPSKQNVNSGKSSRHSDMHRWQGLAVGDNLNDKTDDEGGYAYFGSQAGFLEAVLESIREEENEHEEEAKNASASNSNNGDTASTSSAEAQALLRRDQNFHRYVLNVLVAIGLSMEEVQPAITRSAYALAAGRARDVLGTSSADLDACLESAAPNTNLCDRLYGDVPNTSSGNGSSSSGRRGKRDITFFPRLFFKTAEVMRQDVLCMADAELFWQRLPPKQCVQCYPE